jgi:hypothetical protein
MNSQTNLEEGGVYRLRGQGRDLIAYLGQADTEGWVLYTQQEWDTGTTADLEVQEDGSVTFQGEPTGYTAGDLVFTGRYQS